MSDSLGGSSDCDSVEPPEHARRKISAQRMAQSYQSWRWAQALAPHASAWERTEVTLKARIRDVVAATLSQTGLSDPRAGTLTIATFHRVIPEALRREYAIPGMCVTPDELGWFLELFQQRYEVGTLADTWRRFREGESTPLLALTFDDAQADNFEHARPVLDARRVRASFYAPTGHVESRAIWHDRMGFALMKALDERIDIGEPLRAERVESIIGAAKRLHPQRREERVAELERKAGSTVPPWARMMTWDELGVLADEGHEIGSHSVSHALLPQVSDAQLREELGDSKRVLEEKLGPVETFCYPNGDHDARVRRFAREAGYECAVSTTWGVNTLDTDPFALRRCDIHPFHARDANGSLSAARMAMRLRGFIGKRR